MSAGLDSSAIIAVLNGETGADAVVACLPRARVSAIQVAELAIWAGRQGMPEPAIRHWFDGLKLTIEPFGGERAWRVGLLSRRLPRSGISLGDRACLALALELGLPVLTGDRIWAGLDLGLDIRLIR